MLQKLFEALFSIGEYAKAEKQYLAAKKACDETAISSAVGDIERWVGSYVSFYARHLDGESFVDDDGDDLLKVAADYIIQAMERLSISSISAGQYIEYDGTVRDDSSQGYHGITVYWGLDLVNGQIKLHEPFLTKKNHVEDNYVTDDVYAYYVNKDKVTKKFMSKKQFWKMFEIKAGFKVDYYEKIK